MLLLKQSDPTITGHKKYHPPGGIIELGETLQECLIREIYEEIGVKAAVASLFDVGEWFAERESQVMQFVGLFYVCQLKSDNFKLQKSEVDSVIWVDLSGIDDLDIMEPSKAIIKQFLQS